MNYPISVSPSINTLGKPKNELYDGPIHDFDNGSILFTAHYFDIEGNPTDKDGAYQSLHWVGVRHDGPIRPHQHDIRKKRLCFRTIRGMRNVGSDSILIANLDGKPFTVVSPHDNEKPYSEKFLTHGDGLFLYWDNQHDGKNIGCVDLRKIPEGGFIRFPIDSRAHTYYKFRGGTLVSVDRFVPPVDDWDMVFLPTLTPSAEDYVSKLKTRERKAAEITPQSSEFAFSL